VQNFVPTATRVSRGKIRLAAFGGPSTKPRFRCKNLADISYTDRVIALLSQISLPWQRGSIGGRSGINAIGSIRWPIPENPPIGAKISQKSLTQAELQPILSQISLPWQRGSVEEKCNLQHSMAHPRKPPYWCKNLLRKRSYSPFCPKFRCQRGRVRGKIK